MIALTVFVLAIFLGFELITKVPPTLHTPLMSGANAISGITVVGALASAQAGLRCSQELENRLNRLGVGPHWLWTAPLTPLTVIVPEPPPTPEIPADVQSMLVSVVV